MKTELLVLKSKVCGLERTSAKFRKRIAKLAGEKRSLIRLRKQALGVHTREHLIAYGLLRDVPYDKIESKCAKGNEPNIDKVLAIVQAHLPTWPAAERAKWTRAKVESLLQHGAAA